MPNSIANVYYKLVKVNRRTIKTIPTDQRAAVQALLDADQAASQESAPQQEV